MPLVSPNAPHTSVSARKTVTLVRKTNVTILFWQRIGHGVKTLGGLYVASDDRVIARHVYRNIHEKPGILLYLHSATGWCLGERTFL